MFKTIPFLASLVGLGLAACSPSSTQAPPAGPPQGHAQTMTEVFGPPQVQVKTIGILVYDGVNDLDFTGPKYVLGQVMGASTRLIGLRPGPVTTVMGTQLVPDTVIDSVRQLDVLVVPGGTQGTVLAAHDPQVLAWIRHIDQQSTYTTAVCTGGWILAATDLLRGKKATTNWFEAEKMLAKYGAVYQPARYVRDGKYWTAAGVTAGLDMSLALLREIGGEAYAQAVMLDMEYDPAPPVAGGTPATTPPAVYQFMHQMYAGGLLPLIDSLERVRPPQ